MTMRRRKKTLTSSHYVSVPTCGVRVRTFTDGQMLAYGDARAAHAAAQIKAREVTDDEIDALLRKELGNDVLRASVRRNMHRIVRAAIALANGRG